jgi:hypothetical protein
MGRWHELDSNGDGVWTREEAIAKKDELRCKYVVDPVEVFDVFVKFVLHREEHIWIHPDLRAGNSIHKAYFTYASGDLIMCGYRDERMCANLMQRGVFDAPLREGNTPRVGNTIDSALSYCYGLLQEGGTCDRSLPSTYSVWKKYSDKQCWGSSYEKYVFRHPVSGREKSMLTVDYKAPKAYARVSRSALFRVYKGIIIGMFLLSMYAELKDIVVTWSWVVYYPGTEDFEGEEVIETVGTLSNPASVRIQSISPRHRYAVGCITALRFFMVCMLIWVGVSFLMRDTDWINLLLNGVALVFIMEVANRIFTEVLDPHLQEQFLGTEPMYVEMVGHKWLNKNPALRDLLGFGALCFFMFLIMQVHLYAVDIPLSQAVECACLSSGEKCREASAFDYGFWERYWAQDVPNVYTTVALLKVAAAEGRPIYEIKADSSEVDSRWAQNQAEAPASQATPTQPPPTVAPAPVPSPPPPPPPVADQKQDVPEVEVMPEKKFRAEKDATKGGLRWNIVTVRKPVHKHSGITMLNQARQSS